MCICVCVCVCTVYIYYVYINTHTYSIYFENIYMYILFILQINIFNIKHNILFLNNNMYVCVFI